MNYRRHYLLIGLTLFALAALMLAYATGAHIVIR